MTTTTAVPAPTGRVGYRGRELALLLFAVVLATGALAAVVLAHDAKITATVGWYGLGFGALWGVAHLAVRRYAPAADSLLLPLVAALNGIGLVMIYRLDLAGADRAQHLGRAAPAGLAPVQLRWSALAIVVFVGVLLLVRDHRSLSRYTYTAGLLGLVFLMLPAVPGIGATINGARLWLRLGPFSFQPSEIAKIVLMVFFAGYLVRKREVLSVVTRSFLGLPLPRARDLGPVLIAWLASLAVLVFERDLGSSLLFFGMFLVVLYVATERASWLVIGLGLFTAGAYASYQLFGHVRERVDVWLHAFRGANPTNDSYQLVQGLFGFATGGLTGTGLGRGRPDIVPFARTDFIMASIGEELGLVGVMAVLVMYGLIVMRGLRAAVGVRDPFGKLLATGLAFSLALQVFVIVGGVMRLIPLTGVTLPFVSFGGSSIVANAGLVALLLRISDAGRRPPTRSAPLFDPAAVAESPTEVVRL
ncbi:MAG TPA: FtsW/RodA/SpoVE family cell cycle protein [Frankiaceae bacterium]|nr:FtsW/RodA/SpoVE family cell cycle protein [Frankiaceae bacterium]